MCVFKISQGVYRSEVIVTRFLINTRLKIDPTRFFFSPCRLRLCFNCVTNKYFRGYDRELDLSGWQSRVASFSSITRKVERDWKMVRVCVNKSSVIEKLLY